MPGLACYQGNYICKSSKMEEDYERVKKIGAQLGIEPGIF